jgi:hypothetical protein
MQMEDKALHSLAQRNMKVTARFEPLLTSFSMLNIINDARTKAKKNTDFEYDGSLR